ncbi:response regulator containing a CheY-like receiver domain and an HTH DNA-binding domain [Burkholderiales bacterium JOSHI_001]|nr:response regulator containing a CheY-like receiver domain and an HTH DNA-binding domain [Burkholderiales bacterium JOSHI_001]
MNKIKVLLADDHPIVSGGLRALIDGMDDAEVVAEASNGHEAVALARRLCPDVVLLDIAMPQLNGIDAASAILQHRPEARVVMLSMHTSAPYVTAAIRAGALGYVVKDGAVHELADALRAAARGRSYISPAVASHVVQALRQPHGADPSTSGLAALTARQRQTLQLVAEGHSTRRIAEILHVSPKTVETHRAELMRRLGIHDVAGLTLLALREGLIAHKA